jgi:DtxR family Mn-dependent transcriptional regulator
MAGYPRRCPHGEPIPAADGVMPRLNDFPLNGAESGCDWTISRVNTHDPHKLAYIGEIGLRPGTRIHLISRAPFNGPLQLRVGETTQVIGHELAGVLRVCHPDEYAL